MAGADVKGAAEARLQPGNKWYDVTALDGEGRAMRSVTVQAPGWAMALVLGLKGCYDDMLGREMNAQDGVLVRRGVG